LIKFRLLPRLLTKHAYLVLCVGFGFSLNVGAGGRANFVGSNVNKPAVEDEALQQTLNLNFSPENREKLRKALEDYSRSVDQDHEQIESRRRAMWASMEARFLDADNDGDGTIDRQEATEKLPQVARQFSQIDINQDNVISLNELEEAQNRQQERRKSAEAALEAQKQKLQAAAIIAGETKNKQTTNSVKKRAL